MLKYQVSFCKSYIIEHRVHQFVFKQSRNSLKLIVYYDHAYYYASIAIDEMNRSSVTIQMNSWMSFKSKSDSSHDLAYMMLQWLWLDTARKEPE